MSQMHVDPASGRHFYVDPHTGQSQWADEVVVQQPRPLVAQTATSIPYQQAQSLPTTAAQRGVFRFDGGAAGYLGVGILSFLITVATLGLLAPLGVVMRYRWRAEHTLIDGHPLRFTGTAMSLFGTWLKMWLLCIVTLGIYSFWVGPRVIAWVVEHQQVDYQSFRAI